MSRAKSNKSVSQDSPMTLEHLPTDIIGEISSRLSQKDIRSLASTSKTLAADVKKNADHVYRDKLLVEYGVADWKGAYEMLDYMATKNPKDVLYIYKVNIKNFFPSNMRRCPSPSIIIKVLQAIVSDNVKDGDADFYHKKLYKAFRIYAFIDACFQALKPQFEKHNALLTTTAKNLEFLYKENIPKATYDGHLTDAKTIKEFNAIAVRLLPKLKSLIK